MRPWRNSWQMTSASPVAQFLWDTMTATTSATHNNNNDNSLSDHTHSGHEVGLCVFARMGTLTTTEPQPKRQEDVEDDGFEEDEPQAENRHWHQVQRGVCGTTSQQSDTHKYTNNRSCHTGTSTHLASACPHTGRIHHPLHFEHSWSWKPPGWTANRLLSSPAWYCWTGGRDYVDRNGWNRSPDKLLCRLSSVGSKRDCILHLDRDTKESHGLERTQNTNTSRSTEDNLQFLFVFLRVEIDFSKVSLEKNWQQHDYVSQHRRALVSHHVQDVLIDSAHVLTTWVVRMFPLIP